MAEKKSANNPVEAAAQEVKSASTGSKLEVIGPVDESRGATVFRFYRENEKKPTLDLVAGQTLTIGQANDEITKTEAELLMKSTIWNFKLK